MRLEQAAGPGAVRWQAVQWACTLCGHALASRAPEVCVPRIAPPDLLRTAPVAVLGSFPFRPEVLLPWGSRPARPTPPLLPPGRYNWSNNWQLWLNTSTALQQTLAVCLLTLARQRHNVYVENCMRSIFRQEAELEYRVRLLTGQAQPNPAVTVQSITQDGFARSLDWWVGWGGAAAGDRSLQQGAAWPGLACLLSLRCLRCCS